MRWVLERSGRNSLLQPNHLIIIAVSLQSFHDEPIREPPNGPAPHEISVKSCAKLGVVHGDGGQDEGTVELAAAANLQKS